MAKLVGLLFMGHHQLSVLMHCSLFKSGITLLSRVFLPSCYVQVSVLLAVEAGYSDGTVALRV